MTHDADPTTHWLTLYEQPPETSAAFLRRHRPTPPAYDNIRTRDAARQADDIDPILLMGDVSCTGDLVAFSLLPFHPPSHRTR